jgi:two-component system, LuxR family, sensor kinase FixL
MSWVTIIWSMTAAACLTLAAIHFLVWWQRRTAWADLVFTLTAAGVAVYAGCELSMMRAQTPEQFAAALRWLQVPTWVIVVSLAGFVRLHLRAGRRWLAWSVFATRSFALLLNFLVGQNLNYREVTALRHIPFLGETVSLGVGVSNPLMLVGQLSLLLLVIFTVDATITVWHRGDRRQAVITGGSIVFFALTGMADAVLVLWRMVDMPLTESFFFLGIVVAMGYEMSRATLRAAQLSDDLRESEERMTLAAQAAGFGVWMWTIATNRVWGSEIWLRLFGFAPDATVSFENVIQRIHPDDRESVETGVQRALADRSDYVVDFRVVLPGGTQRWLVARGRAVADAHGKPVRMFGVMVDITARKQSEQELVQKRNELAHLSRVTSVSELSGSLAHELNQPLGIILSNAQAAQELLQQNPPVVGEVSEILTDIVAADRRAAEIIQRLRSLLKRGEATLQALPLNDLIEEVLRLVNADLIGRGVTVIRGLAPDLPPVIGDRIQLQQLTLNLILNAADAMAGNAPGTRRLYIATARHDSTVLTSVRDEGIGLPPDVESLFQPFFTTKPQGLGLGLGICRTIITAHHGRLWAEPHPEHGAVFHFELPVAGLNDQP